MRLCGGAGVAFEEGLDFFEFCEGGAGGEAGEAAAVFEVGFFTGIGAVADEAVIFGLDAADSGGFGVDADFADGEEGAGGGREFPEAVAHFVFDGMEGFDVGGEGEAAVEVDAKAGFGDVGGRKFSAVFKAIELDFSADAVGAGFALETGDGLFEELAIEFKADAGDVAALLGTEEVTGAPEFEVAHCDAEAGAELVVLFEGVEAFVGLIDEGGVAVEKEVGVGLAFEAPNASADLVELREPEAVGAFDDEGVAVGDIDAGFDDGGTDEDVVFARHESRHDFLEGEGGHLPVPDCDPEFGVHFANRIGDCFDGLDAVVEVEDLPAPVDFGTDCVFNDGGVVALDDGFDGPAIGGRGFDDGHGARPRKGEVEGARDGGGAQGEDIDRGAEFLEAFLVFDAEALFLVDHEEAEVFEMNVLTEKAVGSDDAVDAPCGEFGEEFTDFAVGDKAADLRDRDGIGCHAFAEGVEVLLAEDGGGDEDRRLFPGEDCFEDGADRDLGFAEADVAADKAIHGARQFHVRLGGFDRGELIRGFLEGEGVLKFFLPEMVFRKGEALGLVAGGVEAQKLGGVVEGGGFGGTAGFCPCFTADFAEFRGGFGEAHVACKEVGFREGDMEGHGIGEFYREDFTGTVGGLEFDVTAKEADAVL